MPEWLNGQQELKDAGFHDRGQSDGGTRSSLTGVFQIVVNTAPSPGLIFFDSFNESEGNKGFDGFHIITTNGRLGLF